ncbi:MAG: methyltransferase [Paracoccaceae bacterium]|nr:MAG: methyltransferase [Paracoccaceae bacterium]
MTGAAPQGHGLGPLTDDAFLCGRLRLWQPATGYRAATDPVLLAAACAAEPGQAVLDLGCGAGAAALCLGIRVPDLRLVGVEVQPGYAVLARANAARNGIAMQVETGDVAALPPAVRRDFDHVIANPPYYAPGAGSPAADLGREMALREETPLAVWIATAARRLRPGGWMTMIVGADRTPAALAAIEGDGRLGSAVLLPLAPREGRGAVRVILRARKGGRAAFRLLAPLILHAGEAHQGDREHYTDEARGVLRDGAAIRRFG